jgi:Domain of Unknown Function (DUF1080)
MRSRSALLVLAVPCLAACFLLVPPGEGQQTAREPAEGKIDLLPGKDLKGWRRVPLAPDTKLNPKNPWSMDPDGKILICDGAGVMEMLLFEKEFTDGVFHVEWRFRKVEGKDDYNSGVYVRGSLDGKVWHQSQVAQSPKPPRYADLFGATLKDEKPVTFLVEGQGWKLARPPGEWNTYDITCRGPRVVVAVNGKEATTWNDCQVARGHVGLQAEFFYIEFRNLCFTPLK